MFPLFSYFGFSKSSRFLKITKKTENKTLPIFWVNNLSNYVAQHAWTDSWLDHGQIFDSTFSHVWRCKHCFLPTPQKLGTLFVNTIALTDFFALIFCILFFGLLLRLVFGLFFEIKKNKKLTQNNRKRNKTTRCKPENHLVLFTKKESRQHRHKTMHCLDCKQTTQEIKNKNKNTKQNNYLLTNLTQRNTRITGKTVFFSASTTRNKTIKTG